MVIRKNYRKYKRKEEPYRVNHKILADEVRLRVEDGKSAIYPIYKARKMAEEKGLDLVEIFANATPPVCIIVDYTKFKYEKKKEEKERKAKTKKVEKKEIRLTSNTGVHDINFKKRHALQFLEAGSVIKVSVDLRGREMRYKEKGQETLKNFLEALNEALKKEQESKKELKSYRVVAKYPPKQMGRRFFMTIELDKKKQNN